MATAKSAKNAAEAASKKVGNAPSVRGGKEAAVDWRVRADELGVDAVAAKAFDEDLVPQIQAAGYPNSIIKGFLDSQDPHAAAKQFIADERMALESALTKAGWGYTPEQMAGMNLRDLKETVADAGKKGSQPPSRIRNQNQEPAAVESRDGADVPRSESPEMAEPSAGAEAAAVESAKAIKGRSFYSDGTRRGGPGFFREEVRPPNPNFESMASPGGGIQEPVVVDIPAAEPATPSMQALLNFIDRQGTNPDKPKAAARQAAAKATSREQLAADPNKMQMQLAEAGAAQPAGGDAIYAGQGMPLGAQRVGVIEQRGGGGVQPNAGGPQVSPPVEPPAKPAGPSVTETDEVLKYGSKMLPFAREQFKKRPAVAAAATAVGIPIAGLAARYGIPTAYSGLSKLYGAAFGSGEAAPAQGQPQQPAAGGGPRIQILPRSDLRSREVPVPQAPPMAMPPAAQQPAPQPRAVPGRDESTDIIRRLSGRMA